MIDLHCHLLPAWDDGAADRAEADQMADIALEDGISKIVLTPHVYRMAKPHNSVRSLKTKVRTFIKQFKRIELDFYVGAEVYVHPDMIQHIKDFGLTINGSNFVFIEFPSESVPVGATDLVFRMMLEGLIPIISHPERNAELMASPDILYELIRQGAVGQVTSQSLLGGFGRKTQKAAESFLKCGLVHLIASDAHNTTTRPPRLSEAVALAAKFVGSARAEAMVTAVPAAILENEQIPDFGEPVCPRIKSRFLFSLR